MVFDKIGCNFSILYSLYNVDNVNNVDEKSNIVNVRK